ANPALILPLTGYITEIEKLPPLPFIITEATTADIAASHALRGAHGLFVNDSINLACRLRLGISDIVAHDSDLRDHHARSVGPGGYEVGGPQHARDDSR
ncbi:MAG: hypothetical protein ACREEM_40295, partial [Blastocatellia bacterium]